MDHNNPVDDWLNSNHYNAGGAADPFPTEQFLDRRVPGTATRIRAFDDSAKEQAINAAKDELRNNTSYNAAVQEYDILRRTYNNMRVHYGWDFNQMTRREMRDLDIINNNLEKHMKEARYYNSKMYRDGLKMKIEMWRKSF